MFEEFYGLKARAFQFDPDPDFFFKSQSLQRLLTTLKAGLQKPGYSFVITGAAGTGKTMLMHYLIKELRSEYIFGILSFTRCASGEELLKFVLLAFGLNLTGNGKAELRQNLNTFLIEKKSIQQTVVLIIDEAQNLTIEFLELLFSLRNSNWSQNNLKLIFTGDSRLNKRIEQLATTSRVLYDIQYLQLEAFNRKETRRYIYHRIKNVSYGKQEPIFTNKASDAIFNLSAGIPGKIQQICELAMVYGYCEGQRLINAQLIKRIVSDRKGGSPEVGQDLAETLAITEHQAVQQIENQAPVRKGDEQWITQNETRRQKNLKARMQHAMQLFQDKAFLSIGFSVVILMAGSVFYVQSVMPVRWAKIMDGLVPEISEQQANGVVVLPPASDQYAQQIGKHNPDAWQIVGPPYQPEAVRLAAQDKKAIIGNTQKIEITGNKTLNSIASATLIEHQQATGKQQTEDTEIKRTREQQSKQFSINATQQQQIVRWLNQAERQIANKQLMTPVKDNAWATYHKILALSPAQEQAMAGLQHIKNIYIYWAKYAISKNNYTQAKMLFNKALLIAPEDAKILALLSWLQNQEGISVAKPVQEHQ